MHTVVVYHRTETDGTEIYVGMIRKLSSYCIAAYQLISASPDQFEGMLSTCTSTPLAVQSKTDFGISVPRRT
jgi:hypothetical protein